MDRVSSQRKSVAIVGTRGYPSYYGGFETLVRKLAPYLVENNWDVTVYGRPGNISKDDPARDRRVESKITRGIDTKSLSTLSYGLTACGDAVKKKPDVALVLNVANGFWLPLLKARGVPTIVNVDGIEWERAKWGRAAKSVFIAGARATAICADQLVFDSVEIGRRWKEEFGRTGSFIPYGGESPRDFPPLHGLPRGSYALLVARFVPENSVAEFFEAAEQLSSKWDVAIVGSSGYGGPFDEWAQRISASSSKIHWFGHVSDDEKLFALWQNAGAYFHGHSVGGTNPALVQAMACSVPIVARDTVYNREVLADCGILVPPDAGEIAGQIEALLGDPILQKDLRERAKTRQESAYTWENVCSSYHDELRRVLR